MLLESSIVQGWGAVVVLLEGSGIAFLGSPGVHGRIMLLGRLGVQVTEVVESQSYRIFGGYQGCFTQFPHFPHPSR